jgi:hypothetical protein
MPVVLNPGQVLVVVGQTLNLATAGALPPCALRVVSNPWGLCLTRWFWSL